MKQAFPTLYQCDNASMWDTEAGMSLRDHFDGQVLAGIWAGESAFDSPADVARACYRGADAMLREREKANG